MGQLGLSLTFVGIVLVMNGALRLSAVDAKSTAAMNVFTGFLLVLTNLIALVASGGTTLAFLNGTGGLLFGVTYLFIAANHNFGLDWRPFAWYSLGVAVFAVIETVACWTVDLRLALLWLAWAVLWLESFVEVVLGVKSLAKVYPWLSIAEGVFAAFIPAIFMLFDKW
jgi:acid-activated urea channel